MLYKDKFVSILVMRELIKFDLAGDAASFRWYSFVLQYSDHRSSCHNLLDHKRKLTYKKLALVMLKCVCNDNIVISLFTIMMTTIGA